MNAALSPWTGVCGGEAISYKYHHSGIMPENDADDEPNDVSDTSSSTLVNALIGAVVGIVLSFVPLSPVLGGGVAGYLEGGTSAEGLRVGAIAGLIMIIPLLVFAMFILVAVTGIARQGAVFALFGMFVLLFIVAYTVGLSIVGGYLGVYLKDEL